jgi:hypothetical protein
VIAAIAAVVTAVATAVLALCAVAQLALKAPKVGTALKWAVLGAVSLGLVAAALWYSLRLSPLDRLVLAGAVTAAALTVASYRRLCLRQAYQGAQVVFRGPVEIPASGARQEWAITDVISERMGTIVFWLHASDAGLRRPGQARYVFEYSGGFEVHPTTTEEDARVPQEDPSRSWTFDRKPLIKRVTNGFGLKRERLPGTGPRWAVVTSDREGIERWPVVMERDLDEGWRHVAVSWDVRLKGSDKSPWACLYVDGEPHEATPEQAAEMKQHYPDVKGTVAVVIGTWTDLNVGWGFYIGEKMAWFAIFPRALDEPQVKELVRLKPRGIPQNTASGSGDEASGETEE